VTTGIPDGFKSLIRSDRIRGLGVITSPDGRSRGMFTVVVTPYDTAMSMARQQSDLLIPVPNSTVRFRNRSCVAPAVVSHRPCQRARPAIMETRTEHILNSRKGRSVAQTTAFLNHVAGLSRMRCDRLRALQIPQIHSGTTLPREQLSDKLPELASVRLLINASAADTGHYALPSRDVEATAVGRRAM
jgi:hypothetical protein